MATWMLQCQGLLSPLEEPHLQLLTAALESVALVSWPPGGRGLQLHCLPPQMPVELAQKLPQQQTLQRAAQDFHVGPRWSCKQHLE